MENALVFSLSFVRRANTLPVIQCVLQQNFPMGASGFCFWLVVDVIESVWIRNQLDVTYVLSFISPLQVAQHVSDNHVPIIRS